MTQTFQIFLELEARKEEIVRDINLCKRRSDPESQHRLQAGKTGGHASHLPHNRGGGQLDRYATGLSADGHASHLPYNEGLDSLTATHQAVKHE